MCIRDRGISAQCFAEQCVAINTKTAARRDVIRRAGIVVAFDTGTDRENAVRVRIRGDIHAWRWRRDFWVAREVTVFEWKMKERTAVLATKPMSPIVTHTPMLSETGHRFEGAGIGIHSEIAAAQINASLGDRSTVNDAAEQAVRAIDPIIEPDRQAIDACLIVIPVSYTHLTLPTSDLV